MSHLKRRSNKAQCSHVASSWLRYAPWLFCVLAFAMAGSASADRFSAGFDLVSLAGVSYASLNSDDCSTDSKIRQLSASASASVCGESRAALNLVGVDGYEVAISIQSSEQTEILINPQLRSDLQGSMMMPKRDVALVALIYP